MMEKLTPEHRRFLLSVLDCDPQWDLSRIAHLKDLPAVRWKIQNPQRLKTSNPRKFQQQAAAVREKLEQ